jgi:tetratricopeptide (TPR) repeat protein
MNRMSVRIAAALAVVVVVAVGARAQSFVATPEQSQKATVSQRIGLTDVAINYHRPLVNGRKVWGGLVPYGQVWRAGANENTTIEFSDPVMVEGQPLAKGTYGLHMIPSADSVIVIFSNTSSAWGSFTYDQKEDALRVTVKPQPADFHEALTYSFDEVKPDSAVATLTWEKLAVPFHVAIQPDTVLANIRRQLRGGVRYTWEGWNDAATYCLQHKTNLDEALKWTDESINQEERFDNLSTKADLLRALNRPDEAKVVMAKAMGMGNAIQMYIYGRQLQRDKRQSEALDMFRTVSSRFPDHWLGHLALARLNSASGDFPRALKEVKAAQSGAPSDQQGPLAGLAKKLEAKQDINQ